MMTANATAAGRTGAGLTKGVGLAGRVALTFAVAGGVLLGGVYVAVMAMIGRTSGHAVLLTAVPLFVVGALLGYVHGAVLGVLGRGDGVTRDEAVRGTALAALYAIPLATVAFLVAGWIAMTQAALYIGRPAALVGAGFGWVAGAVIVGTAVFYGGRALRNALALWPERTTGPALVGAAFVALIVLFLADAPALWGLRFRTTELGAVLFAGLATIWLVTPLVVVALRALRSLPLPRPLVGPEENRRVFGDVALGLFVGVAVGLLAAPVAAPALGAPLAASAGPLATVMLAAGRAIVDEVLLRLGVVTLVAWTLLRRRVAPTTAAVFAVATGAAVQAVLYLPGILATGFPGTTGAAYLLLAVALPAVAFGALYWKRGLGAALVADTVAVAVLAMIAL